MQLGLGLKLTEYGWRHAIGFSGSITYTGSIFIPSGSTGLLTSDGLTFKVKD